jgi:hypothetical protein
LRFHARDRIEDRHGPIEHPQGTLDLDSEVDVSGGVDQVDSMIPPETRRRRRGDGDPTLLLLRHEIHDGCSVVDLADPVRLARVVQHSLCRRGLAGVDMGHDPDVADGRDVGG